MVSIASPEFLIFKKNSGSLFTLGFVILCLPLVSKAQDKLPTFGESLSYSIQFHMGSFLTNVPKEQYVKDSYSSLTELEVSKQTLGERPWNQYNGFPRLGVGLLFGNSGSREYLGNVAALIGLARFGIIKKEWFSLNAKMGFGPGWVQKPFNAETNYKNFLIGSHINACIQLGLYTAFSITPRIDFDAGVSFTHFSNGSLKVPNLGLNIPAINIGIRYLADGRPKPKELPDSDFKSKTNFYIWTFAAAKEAYPIESATYLVNLLSFEVLRDFSHTGRYGGGINLTYDRALSKEIANSPTYAFSRSQLKLELSIYGAYEYVVGRISIPLQLGFYLYNNYPVASLYENIGLRYRIATHWVAGIELKSHLANGDFIQWGLGYTW